MTYQAIFEDVLAITILVCLILIVRKPAARYFGPRIAYALWLIPLIRLVVSFLDIHVTFSVFDWLNHIENKNVAPILQAPVRTFEMVEVFPIANSPQINEFTLAIGWPVVASFVWISGVLGILLISFIRHYFFKKQVEKKLLLPSVSLLKLKKACCEKLAIRQNVEITLSPCVIGPMISGFTTPIIILPKNFEESYSEDEQKAVLYHELMHVKRFDLWAFLLAYVFVVIQWFNPLMWKALKAFRSDQEAACDEYVLNTHEVSPYIYGATLVKAVKEQFSNERLMPTFNLTLLTSIKERIKLMKTKEIPKFRKISGSLMVIIVGIFSLSLTANSQVTSEESKYFSQEKEIVLLSDIEHEIEEVAEKAMESKVDEIEKLSEVPENATAEELEALNQRISKKANEIMQSVMTKEVQENINNLASIMSGLHIECFQGKMDGPTIIERINPSDNKSHKAVCIPAGDTNLAEFVSNNPNLTSEEKQTFFDNLSQ